MSDDAIIVLTPEQHLRAADVGYRRRVTRITDGYPDRHRTGSQWAGDIEGACAELAASLWTGLPWTGEDVFGRDARRHVPDIGTNVEVRWSAPGRREPVLILDAAKDDPARYFVLVVGFAPEFTVVGWIKGEAARRTPWLTVYPEREVYRVPANELNPVPRHDARAA